MVTLSRRFSAAFILIVALPSLVVSVILARLYLRALYTTVELQSKATAEQVAQNIRTETESAAVLAAALFHDGELRRLADGYAQAGRAIDRFLWARDLDEKLVSFFTYSNRVGEVVLYLRQGGVYRYSNHPRLRAADTVDRSVYAGAAAEPGVVFLLDTLDPADGAGQKHMISIAVAPAPGDAIAVEAILLRFRVPYFDALAAGPGDEAGPDVVMLGRSRGPILSSLPAEAMDRELAARAADAPDGAAGERSSFRDLEAGGRAWLATVRPMEPTGWTLLLLTDEAALSRWVTRYEWYLYPALALLAALFIAYVNRMVEQTERLQAERDMSPGRAAEIRQDRAGRDRLHRIGIDNVERRIALNFGSPYGLEIESEPGSFTLVRYVLPALARSGEPREDAGEAGRV